MSRTIEIGPENVYYNDGCVYAEFSDREYVLNLNNPILDEDLIEECSNAFVCGIMMLSYTEQIEEKLKEFGYEGKIYINKK